VVGYPVVMPIRFACLGIVQVQIVRQHDAKNKNHVHLSISSNMSIISSSYFQCYKLDYLYLG
jgi:hypothetical protein